MKKTASIIAVLLFSIGLTACNTMRGMGRDIERGGEKVQGAATNSQQNMSK
ncbi:Predicted small secreted protein [Noviherbaspirillum humi]|uniref:Predicted small secreted protein n=1 Tax=Noviherbaspirillum humi TaxID=1688639 RepID=A0A239DS78_9BURK|nr:entericidin A/B family lipoprotein [Noviherbaspirillum humi]SNS35177.1 Predicted small secreted protein [Noviherbaspirillum humi]